VSVQDRKQRERHARRQALLDAAASVFAEHGLEDATIEMIADRAEVAVGTIYLYFCSRDHLYLSLVIERLDKLRRHYLEIAERKLAPLDELRAASAAYIGYLEQSRGIFMTQVTVGISRIGKRLRPASKKSKPTRA